MRPQYLIPETPLMVLPSLMKALNGNYTKAIILQQIHFMCSWPKSGVEHGGHRWVWFTYDEFAEQYTPWLTGRNIQKCILELEKEGLLLSATRLTDSWDNTKHYRVDEDAIWCIVEHASECTFDSALECMVDDLPECTVDETPECTVEHALECRVINKETDLSTDHSTQGGETQETREPAQLPPTWTEYHPVRVPNSNIPEMEKRVSVKRMPTPAWKKRLRGCRADVRKFHDGRVDKGAGATPIEVWCEYFPADELNDIMADQIERTVRDEQIDELREAIIAWVSRGYNPKNVTGILEWMDPQNRRSSNHGNNRQQPATTWVAEWQEQQRNGPPARTLAELNRAAAENYPDITF